MFTYRDELGQRLFGTCTPTVPAVGFTISLLGVLFLLFDTRAVTSAC
jgi:hypothetical protein